MKKLFLLIPLLIIVGCASPNPQYTPIPPGQQDTNTVPAFILNPAIGAWSNRVASIGRELAPVNPYHSITQPLIEWGFGIAGTIGTLLFGAANKKNKTTLNAVISGVEASTKNGPASGQLDVKETIATHAALAGVGPHLKKAVAAVTA